MQEAFLCILSYLTVFLASTNASSTFFSHPKMSPDIVKYLLWSKITHFLWESPIFFISRELLLFYRLSVIGIYTTIFHLKTNQKKKHLFSVIHFFLPFTYFSLSFPSIFFEWMASVFSFYPFVSEFYPYGVTENVFKSSLLFQYFFKWLLPPLSSTLPLSYPPFSLHLYYWFTLFSCS